MTLKSVPDEFFSSASNVAHSLGDVLRQHKGNAQDNDQRFCIAVKPGRPLVMAIGAVNPIIEKVSDIQDDYDSLPI